MISPLASPFRGGWRNLTPMRARGRGGQNPWTPGYLSDLRAWYDAEFGQPKNVGYVQLDGTSGDYIFTPDSAALDALDGDIEVVMRVWCPNWATGSTQTLVGRYVSTGNQRCFRFYTSGAGAIGLSGSPDGTSGALVTPSVTPTIPLPTSSWFWMRARLQLSNGSNSVGSLDTAADTGSNYLLPVSWTANGSDSSKATISGIFTGTAPLEIGSFAAGTLERLTGQVGRCIVRSGFDGTTVADFNASDCYGDGYWHSGGYRWTLGLPKIYDRSANNQAPATFGSGSNQPLWLPWLGVASVRLDTASAGTNSISCTAPAGAASYVARSRDYPNVADATGAAAAGAFAFTTTGDWQYISILNGSAVEIARFDASLCTQTGMTDSYSVAWTVNRGTAGRKTVVQSPAARSARSLVLLGTDDWIDVPAAAVPALDTFAAASSVTASFRRWHNPGTVLQPVFTTRASSSSSVLGASIRLAFAAASNDIVGNVGDGTNSDGFNNTDTPAMGIRGVGLLAVGNTSPFVRNKFNNRTAENDTIRTTTVSTSTGGAGRVGAYLGGTAPIDMEFEALVCRDVATSDSEHGLTVAYYGGGL